jgi:hypothetical protein
MSMLYPDDTWAGISWKKLAFTLRENCSSLMDESAQGSEGGQGDGEPDVAAVQVVGLGGGSQEHALEDAVEANHVIDFVRQGSTPLDLALDSRREQPHLPSPLGQRCLVHGVVLDPQQVPDALVRVRQGRKRNWFGGVGDGDRPLRHAAIELDCVHSPLDVSEFRSVHIFADCTLKLQAPACVGFQL